ncbi:hypothetical protein SAMN04488561_4486 [Jiangella alba]|uniref:YnhF family membrane protein n=1 Tax=Jiangella alba TaxID=561176 RepID=A0A1H5PJ33_9ACTN|nr:hypothetical protein SAMN04488561_4486 [Jiangella alba]
MNLHADTKSFITALLVIAFLAFGLVALFA